MRIFEASLNFTTVREVFSHSSLIADHFKLPQGIKEKGLVSIAHVNHKQKIELANHFISDSCSESKGSS